MEISISNFRCYHRKNPTIYNFPKGLCHLVGESGAGKSTVIMTIEWCLYGKNTGVKPRGRNGLNPEVKIKFDEYTIERKNPNFIDVYLANGTHLSQDAAQGWINKTFGSRNLWMATSCLFQGTRNIILSGAGEDKFKILRELTYGTDVGDINNPDWYLGILKAKYKEMDKELTTLANKYDAMYDYLDPLLEKFEKNNDWDPDSESINDIQLEIKELTKAKSRSSKVWAEYESTLRQKDKIESELKKIPKDCKEKLEEYSEELAQLYQELDDAKNTTKLQMIYKRIHDSLVIDSIVQPYKLDKVRTDFLNSREMKRDMYEAACKKRGIPVERKLQDLWLEEITALAEYKIKAKEYEDYSQSEKQISSLKKQISTLKASLTDGLTSDLDELEKTMSNFVAEKHEIQSKLMSLKSKIICPHCEGVIVMDKKSVGKGITVKEENEAKERLDFIIEVLEELPGHITSIQNLQKLEKRLSELNDITIVEPVQSPEIKYLTPLALKDLKITQQNLNINYEDALTSAETEELQELKRGLSIADLITDPDVNVDLIASSKLDFSDKISPEQLKTKIERVKKNIETYQEHISKHKLLCKQLDETDLNTPDEEKSDYYESKINDLNTRLEQGKEFERLNKENESLIAKKEQLDALVVRVDKLADLIEIVKKVSLQPMEEIVEAINVTTNNILEELYDSPIQIALSVSKESSDSENSIKMVVNMQIYYGEESYPNISSLSGGESDRISLALTLALSKLHQSPMLIFDECMASLNSDYREKCLKVIKDTIDEKVIFDICHESVEGYHDEIIEISKH